MNILIVQKVYILNKFSDNDNYNYDNNNDHNDYDHDEGKDTNSISQHQQCNKLVPFSNIQTCFDHYFI